MNKPNILDPNFKYTPSSKTDITRTFARIRRELKNSTTNQDNNKPLVEPSLPQNGFVLNVEFMNLQGE